MNESSFENKRRVNLCTIMNIGDLLSLHDCSPENAHPQVYH